MHISEIYDYLKRNGVERLSYFSGSILIGTILIANHHHAWFNIRLDHDIDHFTTKSGDAKLTREVTISDLDKFVSEYKHFYSEDRIRDQRKHKLQLAIREHKCREALRESAKQLIEEKI